MVSHWDDVPWSAQEHEETRCERQRLRRSSGRAGATLGRGLNLLARVEPLDLWDGEA